MTLRWLVAAAAAGLVLLLTLTPSGSSPEGVGRCMLCNPRLMADVADNVALFVPFGLSLSLLGLSAAVAAALGASLSGVIELLQSWVPGRDATLVDFVANTIGAGLGAWAMPSVQRWRSAPVAHDGRSLIAAALACMTWIATGALIAPSWTASDYWGQWTPVLDSIEPYKGKVLAARVGEMAVPSHRISDSAGLRATLAARAPVRVEVLIGPPPIRVSSIFNIADAEARRVLLVGASGHDLIIRYRSRAADWTLDQPALRIAGALERLAPGDRTTIVITRRTDDYCARVGEEETCGLGFGAGDGWSLLLSSVRIPPDWRVRLGFLWMSALVAPVGFFARGDRRTTIALAAIVACLLWLPGITELRPTRIYEWVGVAAGLAGAALLARAVRQRSDAALPMVS